MRRLEYWWKPLVLAALLPLPILSHSWTVAIAHAAVMGFMFGLRVRNAPRKAKELLP